MKPQTRRSTSNKSPAKGKNSNKTKQDPKKEELYDEEANMSTDESILTDSEEEYEDDDVSEEEDSGIVDDMDEMSEDDEELEEDEVSEIILYI